MVPRTRLSLALALIVGAATTPAFGQSQAEYQMACQDDALRLCSEHVPDHAKIRSCLVAKKASLTAPCRALVSPTRQKKQKQS